METLVKTIELFGLPACGKSTLARYLLESNDELKIGTAHEGRVEIIRSSPLKWIGATSPKTLYDGYLLSQFFPKTDIRKDLSLRKWLLEIYVKCYNYRYSKYDYIIDDSSLIQQIISWERGEDFHDNPEFILLVKKLLSHFPKAVYVFCEIDINIAIERINSRGRQNGRLDVIALKSPGKLSMEYFSEKKRFEAITRLLTDIGYSVIKIEMNQPCEIIAQHLLKRIKQLQLG